ncbi:MAG TPA: AbgT family transporter [Actinomycetota bacterium]
MRGGGRRGRLARILDGIERAGNRLPDPLTLFVIAAALVVVASAVASLAGVTATHPGTGEAVRPVNLLSRAGLRRMLLEMVPNFTAFPPLGTVLVVMLGIGVAERSGLVAAALRRLVTAVPAVLLPAALVFAGVMSSLAADAGYVVLTPLGAVLFAGVGRHPLAGLAAAFAGVSAGFSANLLVTALDPLLAGITQPAARLVDPAYVVDPTANYYFMIASTVLLTAVGTVVTTRVVEPRLGRWSGTADTDETAPAASERRGLAGAALAAGAVVALVGLLAATGVLRDDAGGWTPFFGALVPLLMLFFLVPGLAYGRVVGTIRSDRDVATMTSDTMATMGSYVVLAFVAAQLVAYFAWSNLGLIVAVHGAGALRSLGIGGLPLLVGFVLVSAAVNLLIGSASAKWAIMAPVFVPMLMLMGYAPETVQVAYRVGDSVTNVVTPLLPYFPIVISFARRYDPDAGLGTLVAAMLPYSVAFLVAWLVLLVAWVGLGVPLGPGAPIGWSPG